jgi:predicted nucleotidyltransferase
MIVGLTSKEEGIITDILREYSNEYEFFYYGSRVNGQFSKTSDLDIFIKGISAMSHAVLCDIKEKFDGSALPFIVNFVDYHKIDDSFYKSIQPNLIRIVL